MLEVCWWWSSTVQRIHSCLHTHFSTEHAPTLFVHTHTHTLTKKPNFVLLFWPPPLLVFILICMRGVHRGVSRAFWSCASSVKHTWTCKATGTHTQHGAEGGTRQRGAWTHQHFKWSSGGGKRGFDIKNPSSSQNSEEIKEQSRNKCTIVSDVRKERWWFISILIYVHTLSL